MQAHPIWPELVVHDDAELGRHLGAPVASRVRVHEWPLTVTDKVTLDDGRSYAYKAQLPPSIEIEFYAAAPGDLVPAHIDFPHMGQNSCGQIATEWIGVPSLRAHHTDVNRDSADTVVRIAEQACEQIAHLDPSLPVTRDFSGVEAWRVFVNRTLEGLSREVDQQRYPGVAYADVRRLREWAEARAILRAVDTEAVIQHGDLTGDEVFPTGDGVKIIDWQRPLRGPRGIDLANLLHDLGIPSRGHVEETLVQISRFVLIDWAVSVSTEVLPEGAPEIPGSWVRRALHDMFPTP